MKRSASRVSRAKKLAGKKARAHRAISPPGQHTLREIFSQPAMWAETSAHLAREGTIARLSAHFTAREPWLFVACGSSYYLSQLICAIWTRNFSIPCMAVPASELLFAPEEILLRSGATQVMFVSRSGETTEVLRAAKCLQHRGGVRTLGVTCNAASPFEQLCTHTFTLPWADEKSTVMTRSFTSILLSFQRLGAHLCENTPLAASLNVLPELSQPWLAANADRIRKFARQRQFADFVFLGQGAHYWLAQEAALKITEMSASYAQAYHTLEFRHGPRSIAGPATLITFFISDTAADEEALLVSELKSLGAANLVIVNRSTPRLERASDLLVAMNMDAPEFARFPMFAIPAQLLGAAVGLRKGLDPDAPRNLTRAVVLAGPAKFAAAGARRKKKT